MLRGLLVFLTLALSIFSAHAYWQSRDSGYNLAVAVVNFQGPGDVQSGALAYWLTNSCYTKAYSGKVADLVDTSHGGGAGGNGSRQQCSNGSVTSLVSGSACTFQSGNACSDISVTCAVACKIVTLYDQTAGTQCGGSPCDITQATNSNRPDYTSSAIGTTGCATFTASANQTLAASGTFTLNQAFTIVMVAKRTTTGDLYGLVRDTTNTFGSIRAGYLSAANKAGLYAGTTGQGATANDSVFHQLTDVFNGASSSIAVDGSNTTGLSPGATGFSATSIAIGWAGTGSTVAIACEAGLYSGTSVNATNLYNNATARYGAFP